MGERTRVVAVVGTNASGKSSLGVALAREFGGEVVSADSRQVYRGLDIGAGKLSEVEMRGVPHHLIDVADIDDVYSLAEFQRAASAAIHSIRARGRVPIVVGGTALYLRAILRGYNLVDVPPDPGLRERLGALDPETLIGVLRILDSDAAAAIDFRNSRRTIRAIEIALAGYRYGETRTHSAHFDSLQLGVTWPRPMLRERIARRLDDRIASGMVEEVRRLLASGVSHERLDSFGLEYRYVLKLLSGEYESTDEFASALGAAIYRFARKQLAWFRADPSIVWLDNANLLADAEDRVRAFLN